MYCSGIAYEIPTKSAPVVSSLCFVSLGVCMYVCMLSDRYTIYLYTSSDSRLAVYNWLHLCNWDSSSKVVES